MQVLPIFAAAALLTLAAPPFAVPVHAAEAVHLPVTMEYYYRTRWGSLGEFKRLYFRNHAPLLAAMQKAGFIRSIAVEEPFTHMAGAPRWDLRVTVVFRDAAAAVSDPAWDRLWEAERQRQFPDKTAFDAEEDRRFALLEEHWDIIVNPVAP